MGDSDIVIRETEQTDTSTSSPPGVHVDGHFGRPLTSNQIVATLESIFESRDEEWNIYDIINHKDPDAEDYFLISLRKRFGLVRVDGKVLNDVDLLKFVTLAWLNDDTERQVERLEQKFLNRYGLNITPVHYDESCT